MSYLGRDFAAKLPLDPNKLLDVGVLPQCSSNVRFCGRQWLARKASVAIELLQEEFGAGNGCLGDGKVTTSDDALETLGFR